MDQAFNTLVQSTPTPVFVLDVGRRRLCAANPALAALLRYPSAVAELAPGEVFADPEDPDRLLEFARKNGRLTNFETGLRLHGGGVLPIRLSVDVSETVAIFHVLDDSRGDSATPRHMAGRTTEEQKFAAIFDNTPLPSALVRHATNQIVEANPAFFAMTTSTHGLVGGTTPGAWRDSASRVKFLALLEADGRVENFETELMKVDGSILPVAINCALVEIDGDLHRLVQFVDLRERRVQEERLLNAQRRLEQAQQVAHLGDFVLDLATFELTGSPELYELAGLDPGTELTLKLAFEAVHPDDIAAITERARDDVESQTEFAWEYRVTVGDGEERIHHLNARVVRDATGMPRSVYGTVQDVTDERRAERERLAFETKVLETQKLESLGLLAGGIAHDFNNLLASVIGHTDLAMLEPLTESARGYLSEVRSAAKGAAELTRQLLAYSGQGQFVLEVLDLDSAVVEMENLLKVSVADSCTMRLERSDGAALVRADASQIRQVVMNIIINASESIDHEDGAVDVTTGIIELSERQLAKFICGENLASGSYAYIEVKDNGVGMGEKTLERIFEPFFTTKFTGRGLGLAAVLGIMRGHNGALSIESRQGVGTTVAAFFPLAKGPVTHRKDRTDPVSEPVAGAVKVLVVDDDDGVRQLLETVLRRFGCRPLAASSGREAIEVVRDHDVRLVLLDNSMPHMDGAQCLERLRANGVDIPVIVMSGYSELDTMARYAALDVEGFIAKPFAVGTVLERVQEALGKNID